MTDLVTRIDKAIKGIAEDLFVTGDLVGLLEDCRDRLTTTHASILLERLDAEIERQRQTRGDMLFLGHPDDLLLDLRSFVGEVAEAKALGGLNWLAENVSLELSWGEIRGDLSDCAWRVHRCSGGINDREWTFIASGDTPLEALANARAVLS